MICFLLVERIVPDNTVQHDAQNANWQENLVGQTMVTSALLLHQMFDSRENEVTINTSINRTITIRRKQPRLLAMIRKTNRPRVIRRFRKSTSGTQFSIPLTKCK